MLLLFFLQIILILEETFILREKAGLGQPRRKRKKNVILDLKHFENSELKLFLARKNYGRVASIVRACKLTCLLQI